MSIIHKINGRNVRTSFDYPPIPVRSFDWSAIDDDTYDGADDSHCPIGRGSTEQEAIEDLLEQLDDAPDQRLSPEDEAVLFATGHLPEDF